jgi:hypothetical protein
VTATLEGLLKYNESHYSEDSVWFAHRKASEKEYMSSQSQRASMGERFNRALHDCKTAIVSADALARAGKLDEALGWWRRAIRYVPQVKFLGHAPALAFITVVCVQYVTELGSSRLNVEVFLEQTGEWMATAGITEVSETVAAYRLAEFCRTGLREPAPSNYRNSNVYTANANNKPFAAYAPYHARGSRGGGGGSTRRDDNNNNRGSNNNNNRGSNNNYRESGRNSARGPLAITNGSGGRREAMKGGNPSAPDCRDFKLGKCTRAVCSFKH